MSPAPDALDRMLRVADRAAQSALAAGAVDRIERAVLARAAGPGGRPASGLPAWLPAASAAGAIALAAFLIGRGETPGIPAGGASGIAASAAAGAPTLSAALDSTSLVRAAKERFGLPADAAVRRIVLADFERFADKTVTGLAEGALIDIGAGAASGAYSLQVPSSEDGLILDVPAADRLAIAGVSAWTRGGGPGVTIELTAVLEDGTEVAGDALRIEPAVWRQALFPLDPVRVRAGGGVRRLRFAIAGRDPARLDKIELWTTAVESRR